MSDCPDSGRFQHAKILLVDDDPEFVELIRIFLGTMSFRVSVAKDGVEALKKVMVENFDLIFCDLTMPNLPGDMFYQALKRTKPELCRRFMFVTGTSEHERLAGMLENSRHRVWRKPVNPLNLVHAIKTILADEEHNRIAVAA